MKNALVAPLLVAFLTVSSLSLLGCDDDVGVPCSMTVGEETPQITANALDCYTRLCLFVGDVKDTKVAPLCTKFCDSDDDCPSKADTCPNNEKFVCTAVLQTGALRCCKMCVCNYFIPKSGLDTGSACSAITPNCPKL